MAAAVPAGGRGRRWPKESFFFEPWCLGIPGICSQENGTPLNLMRGVLIGLNGGKSSLKENDDDLKDESKEPDGDDEENDGVRLPVRRNAGAEYGGSSSFGRSGVVWPLLHVGEVDTIFGRGRNVLVWLWLRL